MKTGKMEITEEEAALLPLLYKVPVSTTLEAAAQAMRVKLLVDGLVAKAKAAMEAADEHEAAEV